MKSTSSENRSTANYFHLSESSPNYFSVMKVVSKYNTVSTANACTHQKQQILEITRHMSRFYLQYKFHVRDLHEHIFNKLFCPIE